MRHVHASALQSDSGIRRRGETVPTVDLPTSARVAQLRYVNDVTMPGIHRHGRGRTVHYVDARGRTVAAEATLRRIRALAIPPAWTHVWICPDPNGHLQATGRDARGRKQYRYHPRWREVRDSVKYGRLLAFAKALPHIRARTAADLRLPGLSRPKVLATVVQLLDKTLIRVGNEEYARDNHSFGLTTMRDEHAKINGSHVRFEFRGKSGISHSIDLADARLARIVKACRDLPGHELFQYVDDEGRRRSIESGDVNQYLRDITNQPFTSKEFRTWAGTVLAARALAMILAAGTKRPGKRNVRRAVEAVAQQLGNTVAVCRKCYIHPAVVNEYLEGRCIEIRQTAERRTPAASALSAEERAVVALLKRTAQRKPISLPIADRSVPALRVATASGSLLK
jgi:DNA topoisomerase I